MNLQIKTGHFIGMAKEAIAKELGVKVDAIYLNDEEGNAVRISHVEVKVGTGGKAVVNKPKTNRGSSPAIERVLTEHGRMSTDRVCSILKGGFPRVTIYKSISYLLEQGRIRTDHAGMLVVNK